MNIQGTGVAVATPFDQNLKLDEKALRDILQHLIDGQVEYLVMLGTTGESPTLAKDEKARILDIARETTGGSIPIVAGIGGNNTHDVLQALENTNLDGVDAILSVGPYYNKPSQKGLIRHYQTIADQSPVPVILYNVPGRTGKNFEVQTTLELAGHPNICGIKEASGDPQQCMEIIQQKPKDFQVVSGDDHLTLAYMGIGMDGVISVTANAFPHTMSEMVRAGLKSDFTTAREFHYQLMPYFQAAFAEGSPGGLKALMNIKGLCQNIVRLPLATVSEQLFNQLKDLETHNKDLK